MVITGCEAANGISGAMYVDQSASSIKGGTFDGSVLFDDEVSVSGGTFNGDVQNKNSIISGGTFLGGVRGAWTVTFDTDGGSAVAKQIRANAAATKPDSRKAGYTLVGWYTDEACTAAYDFTKPVTDNITLYAKWEAAPRYYYNSGTTTDTDNADEDKKGSPKTFDPGVGIYAVSVALSLTGTAWIGRKRH